MKDRDSVNKNLSNTVVGALESASAKQTTQKTRLADAILAAGGAAGSLALLQAIQDYLSANAILERPITGGFLVGSAIKFFLNRNPPSLEAFWKSTAFSIVIGSSLHLFLWTTTTSSESDQERGAMTILSKEYSGYLLLFIIILYWKLDAGTIWGAGKTLASFLAFQSGFWGQNAAEHGSFQTLVTDFPIWYILGPYLMGHCYLYLCALGLAKIRRRVRIYLLRNHFFTSKQNEGSSLTEGPTPDRGKLRVFFDRIDTSGDGRLDAMELKLALRATVGEDISLEECKIMIGAADTDGDGTLDFNEFCEAVDNVVLQ